MAEQTIRLGLGTLSVVAEWPCRSDVTLRVVRWALWGRERALYRWARGLDLDLAARAWVAGVALERRDGPGQRWQTLTRHEAEGVDGPLPEARLRGWEAGLLARAAKLATRLGPIADPYKSP